MRAHLNDNDPSAVEFEDPVTIRSWCIQDNGGDVMIYSTSGSEVLWIRASDAASIGDWLRRRFANRDWRVGADPENTSIPIAEPPEQ